VEDKRKGLSEYIRVAMPGGYLGINEATWIKPNPSIEFVEYISRITGADLETSNNWEKLLENTGLEDIEVRTYKINAMGQFIDEIRYIGIKDFARGWYKFLSLFARNASFREYIKEARPPKSVLKNYYKYLGYGLYIGRK